MLLDVTSVTILGDIADIDTGVFEYCDSLISVTIPQSVTKISSVAFKKTDNLKFIYTPNLTVIPANMKELALNGFFDKYVSGVLDKETINIYLKYIKRQWSKLAQERKDDLSMFIFATDKKIIPLENVDEIIESTENVEIKAVLLDHKNSQMTSNMKEKLEKKEERKIEIAFFGATMTLAEAKKKWKIKKDNDGNYEISAYIGKNPNVVIPDKISKGSVISINESAFENSQEFLQSVTIPGSVKKIESGTFSECSLLQSVIISPGVKFIEENAFYCCTSLTHIEIPKSVTKIGAGAFSNCSSITNIIIPESVTNIEEGIFSGCTSLVEITVHPKNKKYSSYDGSLYSKNGTVLYQYAIGKNSEYFDIPESVVEISASAFSGCNTVKNINIPNNVRIIGASAFKDCTSLTSIDMPNGVSEIKDMTFRNCKSLKNIVIPDGVTDIGDGAFSFCTSLASINIPNNVTNIGCYVFNNCTSLKNVSVGNITSIGKGMFRDCLSLENIRIPNTVTDIGESAFENCASLKYLPNIDNVISIGEYAFYNCTSITDIILPKSLKKILAGAFKKCTSLETVVINEGTKYIGKDAFMECTSLKYITIPRSVNDIYSRLTYRNPDAVIRVYSGTKAEKHAITYHLPYEIIE